ncbi:hypothetical protein VE01_07681 [Pseudogymnoascus verrucosus]|uniref:Uncharacterized protein n=1 Tax=Pseudogymnoascus verrucosus TaxID=342668 RepID=A0A1B8GF08_9PEZI|nr:uncharacterized protein VE01_07681 [Pseudogymnoascus verrucosus]OBT94416.2 hypothetical protein VE01_07681 [Pseudogymnoascus verrucosus]
MGANSFKCPFSRSSLSIVTPIKLKPHKTFNILSNMSIPENRLPVVRRILASNLPLPTTLSTVTKSEPAVEVTADDLSSAPILDGNYAKISIFNHKSIPASTVGHGKLELEEVPGAGIVLPGGANIYYLDIAPGYSTSIHRTTSVDYMVFQTGEVVYLTPDEAFNPETGKGRFVETLCKAGDILIQRATLHGWANRTDEWVRILCVVLDAKSPSTDIQGGNARHQLSEVWDV